MFNFKNSMIQSSFTAALLLGTCTSAIAYPGHFDVDLSKADEAVRVLKTVNLSSLATSIENRNRDMNLDAIRDKAQIKVLKSIAYAARPADVDTKFAKLTTLQQHLDHINEAFNNHPLLIVDISKKFDEEKDKIELDIARYSFYCQKFGSVRWERMEGGILDFLSTKKASQEARQQAYNILTSTGFLKNVQGFDAATSLMTNSVERATAAFLQKKGRIEELGLGDGSALDGSTCDKLGIPSEAACGSRPFTFEDINAKALRVDMDPNAAPDILANMHDEGIFRAIQRTQGLGSLSKVADRSWCMAHMTHSTLHWASKLLKVGGIYEIWEGGNDKSQDLHNIMASVGFEFKDYDKTTQRLQYQKVAESKIPADFDPMAYWNIFSIFNPLNTPTPGRDQIFGWSYRHMLNFTIPLRLPYKVNQPKIQKEEPQKQESQKEESSKAASGADATPPQRGVLTVKLPEPADRDGATWTSRHPFHNKEFLGPYQILPDGNCFFYCMQISREEMVNRVNAAATREDIRRTLALEFVTEKVHEMEAELATHQGVLTGLSAQELSGPNENEVKSLIAERKDRIETLTQQIEAAWQRIVTGTYPTPTVDEIRAFTTQQYLTQLRFAGADFMKCCAMTLNWNLYVWSQHRTTNSLSINSFVERAQPARTVHILLKNDHCELLVPKDAPQAEKERALEIEERTLAVNQDVRNLYKNGDIRLGDKDGNFIAELKKIKTRLFLSPK